MAQPIAVAEIANLANLGISPDSIKFGDLTMESDGYIAIREKTAEGKTALTTVELVHNNQVVRRPISAEAAIFNPKGAVIALRAGQTLQMFDINAKQKLKSYKLEEEPTGFFWRWISNEVLALVTSTSVYHWSLQGGNEPEKMFDRHASLASTQIINYRATPDYKWLLLIGIAPSTTAPGTVDGQMQLYSVEKKVSQPLQGHAGCFTQIAWQGDNNRNVLCFIEKKPGFGPKLFCMEVGKDKDAPGGVFKIPPQEVPFTPDAAQDFPVALLPSKRHDLLYLITKLGYLFVLDVFTAETIFRQRISQDTIFVTCSAEGEGAVLGVTARKGSVMRIGMNESALVPYLLSQGKSSTAMRLATKLGLAGADNLYTAEFERLFQAGDYKGAAKVASESPGGRLRTMETINRFKALQGTPPPVLQYFQALLEKGKLNAIESLELARPVVAQQRIQMISQWLGEDKLECSEPLGDLLLPVDDKMALSVYLKAGAHDKVVACLIHAGDFPGVVNYARRTGHHPDYVILLQNLVRQDPKRAEAFAKMLVQESPPMVNVGVVVDVFMQLNRIQETTSFLLEALKGDRPEEGPLQTRLLEINLLGGAPQVADAIFANEMFHHYDRAKVGRLCEKAGLFQRALEHYTSAEDSRRVIVYTQALNPEFLVNYFGKLAPEDALASLDVLLQHNLTQNLPIVVQVASKYYETLTPTALVALFEKYRSYEGLYFFTGSILPFSQDPDVHFKYLESAVKMGQVEQAIKVCRESTAFDPVKVKDYLLAEKFHDPRPLIHVCDRFGFVEEMTAYLFNNKLTKHIEVYVERVSPQNAPLVVGKLLDLDAEEDLITRLLASVRRECPVDALVEEVEKRNRLRLLRPWLEARVAEGSIEHSTHDALAKIYISTNHDPESFLKNNQFYDSKIVGAFCRKLDPHLALVAYRRSWGQCDAEVISLTDENELFKDQARYLVQRQDAALWATVLRENNPHRRRVVDETVQTALPECREAEQVSNTVRAFMTADMPHELIEILDRLVLQGTPGDGFSENPSLQNLLLMTAIKTEPSRVMDLAHRLEHYDAGQMAEMACQDSYKLYEEAFEMYKRAGMNAEAVEVLLVHLESLDRAVEFANKVDDAKVWSRLARAQLDANFVKEAIDSFIKADDAEYFLQVIAAAQRAEAFEDLVRYLRMARKKVKEPAIDSELIYTLARTNKTSELEEFVAAPNVANVQDVGDRCFREGMYEAAAALFQSVSNNAQLARAYVKLGKYKEAVECARKANAIKTWKEVNAACVEAGEWRLAEVSGQHILKAPDHIDDLVAFYEGRGHYEELVTLFEKGLSLEGANKGVFTGLAVLYARHHPERLLDHIKKYGSSKLILPKVLHACEENRLWKEAAVLYEECGEHDNAVRVMMDHPETAFEHAKFLAVATSIRNAELYYKAITFYLGYAPDQLGALLTTLSPKLDHARAVSVLKKANAVPLGMGYLKSVQSANLAAVNEAMNEVYIEEEDFEGLKQSIDEHANFDHVALAKRLESHELLNFRKIGAFLFAKQKRFAEAIKLLKQDRAYKDAMETARDSNDPKLARELLEFFVKEGEKECFSATLFHCYELIPADVTMEIAWKNGLVDQAMPYMIQSMRDMNAKIRELDERTKPKKEADAGNGAQPPMMMGGGLMLMNAAYVDPAHQAQMMYHQQQQQQQQQGMGGMGFGNNGGF